MRDDKALEVLVKELISHSGITFVERVEWESFIQDIPSARRQRVIGPKVQNVFTFSDGKELKKAISRHLGSIGANYFVVEVSAGEGMATCIGTPYRVIGDDDAAVLKDEICYRENEEADDAYESFILSTVQTMLKAYRKNGAQSVFPSSPEEIEEAAEKARQARQMWKKGEKKANSHVRPPGRLSAGDLIYSVSDEGREQFMIVKKYEWVAWGRTTYAGPLFADPLFLEQISKNDGVLNKDSTVRLEGVTFAPYLKAKDFLGVLFSLPEGARDIEVDKDILARIPERKFALGLMRTMYLEQPRLFPQLLTSMRQEERVELIRWVTGLSGNERYPDVDRQFLDMAYDGGCPEYHLLLTTDSEGFLTFFEGIGEKEQRGIVDALYRLDEVPKIVMDMLSERYPDLVKEVGVHHVKEGDG